MELPAGLPLALLLFLLLLLLRSSPSSADDFTVSSHPAKLVLPPSSKPGHFSHHRIHIRGFPRLRHPDKYANSLKLRANFAVEDSGLRTPFFEVCFHRNASVPVGTCPSGSWEKVSKGLWVQSMSPYGVAILDVRLSHGASSRLLEISTEEEFLYHRVVFLVVGVVLMVTARWLSQSVVFYYGSAMTIGILLVILMVLFHGMKLLPTGRKSSFAIFMYSSVIGVGTFLLRYISGLLRSLLAEIGINEDMHNPLFMLLICCLVLVGAWLGFWSVRKLVLAEDGYVDESIAYFVEWAILIFSAAMIVESSLDSLLAVEALIFSVVLSIITRRTRKLKFLHRLFRKITVLVKEFIEYFDGCESLTSTPESGSPTSEGLPETPPIEPSVEDMHYSTFHKTSDRKKYTDEVWKKFTRNTTRRAVKELCSSPGFGSWAAENADRISVTPVSGSDDSNKIQRRLF